MAQNQNSTTFPFPGSQIRLDAGKAFGSGSHPTTALCMTLLEDYLAPGDSVVDVGTGSGILLVAAAGLGAGKGIGFDRHPSAVATARRNLALNRVDEKRFAVLAADDADVLKTRFDLAVVNILPEIIAGLIPGISRLLKPGGIMICSGMIQGNTHRVEAGLQRSGFGILKNRHKGMWVGIAARHQSQK